MRYLIMFLIFLMLSISAGADSYFEDETLKCDSFNCLGAATISGAFTAASVSAVGAISGASAAITGEITAESIVLTGTDNYRSIDIPLNGCTAEVAISDTAGTYTNYLSFDLDASTQESISFAFMMPYDYADGGDADVFFFATAGASGNVYMSGEVLARNDGETLEAAVTELSAETVAIVSGDVTKASLDLGTGIISGDRINIKINRVADQATYDTLAADLKILNIGIRYAAKR